MKEAEVELAWSELSGALDATVQLLTDFGEESWAARLAEGRAKVDAHGANGLDSILRWFGGMGSLNDLILHPMNGHTMTEGEIAQANDRLWELRDRIYTPAKALRNAFPS